MPEKNYPYKVSACILTYNQAEYIKNAIEGALKQQVDFPYEIIIGDDCSTDGTREILLDYKQRYPDLIKLNLQQEHYEGIPGRLNNITNIRSAQGKYIAFCDGDDYWLSEDKLQKQAVFMDAHPEYSFCFHNGICRNEVSQNEYKLSNQNYLYRKSNNFYYKNIVRRELNILASSCFFRKKYFEPLPAWFWDVYLADRILQLIAVQKGPARFMKGLTMCRRITKKSVSQSFSEKLTFAKLKKKDIQIIRLHFPKNLERPLSFKTSFYLHQFLKYKNEKKYKMMVVCLLKSIYHDRRACYFLTNKIISKINFLFIRYTLR